MFSAANFTTLLASLSLAPALERPAANVAGPLSTQSFLQTSSSDACAVDSYTPPPPVCPEFAPFDNKIASIYRYRKQQSVNLGSWFVQENWMVPSIFKCASGNKAGELDVASGWGNTTNSRQLLERHWDTWIQDSDFAYLRSIGINTVRLPIGFWSLGPSFCQGTPFEDVSDVYVNSWPRVLQAIKTAEGYGIGVLIDLHGAPGSQNGQSHSGTSDGKVGLFDSADYMNKTINVLTFLTEHLTCVNNVVGIQLLNEPVNVPNLPEFYERTLTAVRGVSEEAATFPFYIHDAFNLNQYGNFVANRTDFLVEDHHSYFVYTPSDQAESAQGHTHDVNTTIYDSLASTAGRERGNLVVDEWSCALTDKSLSQESNPSTAQQNFCTEQMEVYASSSAGWSFWSYYMEDCRDNGGWCFKQAVGNSLPATFFSYPGVSSTPRDPLSPMGDSLSFALANLTTAASIGQIVELAFMTDTSDHRGNSSTPSISGSTPNSNSSTVPAKRDQQESSIGLRLGARRHQVAIGERQAARRSQSPSVASAMNHTGVWDTRPNSNSTEGRQPPSPFSHLDSVSANQAAIARGYQDGFTTSKVFAQYGMSRLGFTGQYIADTMKQLIAGQEILDSEETMYATWFKRGLSDGEAQVTAAITQTVPVYSHPSR